MSYQGNAAIAKKRNILKKRHQKLLRKAINDVDTDSSANQVYAEYMAAIVKQISVPGKLQMLTGTADAQASFYYLTDTTDEINQTLYNKLLNQRVVGEGNAYDVPQVALSQDSFTNSYNSVYTKIRYQLSSADKSVQQRLNAETASTMRSLIPVWNNWVEASGSDVSKLSTDNTDMALVQMTGTMNTDWLNPDYESILRADPSYPYTHLNDFGIIYNKMPLSVPKTMRDLIIDTYSIQGAAGSITAQVANATQTLAGILNNIQNPTTGDAGNGGSKITGSDKNVPGLLFEPARPLAIADLLSQNPVASTLTYSRTVTKTSSTMLSVQASASGGISIPILSFFSFNISGGAEVSVFNESFAGTKYSIAVKVNNPTSNPLMAVNPVLYNISTKQGWMSTAPAKEAIKNGYPAPTNVTGYVFNSKPSFDFEEGKDFGYINSAVFSQFLELEMTFEECDSEKVRNYFEQHASATFKFLGIPLGGVSESASYEYTFSNETTTKITVTMKPAAPGYTPGTDDITQSLAQLVAVGVTYPFA